MPKGSKYSQKLTQLSNINTNINLNNSISAYNKLIN